MKNIAAFFDIDGTLYREGLITEVFKKFITYELVDKSKWRDEVKPSFMAYDKRIGEYDHYLKKMVNIYTEALIGISDEHVKHIAHKVIEQKGERLYMFTRNQILYHKANHHITITISGSPFELVEEMAQKHQFDDYRGTVYVTDDHHHYTGEVIPMWDHISKQKAIEEFVKKYDIDLSESYAYGDTTGDFTMFELVGHPYAINPTKELLEKILATPSVKEKITVIVERKNVIYKIDLDNFEFM